MAKVIGPLHSSEARGSVSSLTYNTWRGISTVKARAGPTTQYSDAQVALRALAALATASWKSLTDTQRSLWNHYADTHTDIDWTGNPQRLSGYNWYIRINVRRQLIAQGIETSPPTTTVLVNLEYWSVNADPTELWVDWTAKPTPPVGQYYVEVYLVGPTSAGRHPNLPHAHREAANTYETRAWEWFDPPAGTYTLFGRMLRINGCVGPWRRGVNTV